LRDGVSLRADVLPPPPPLDDDRVSFGMLLAADEAVGVETFAVAVAADGSFSFSAVVWAGVEVEVEAGVPDTPAATMVRLGLREGMTIFVWVRVVFLVELVVLVPKVFLVAPLPLPVVLRTVVFEVVTVVFLVVVVFALVPLAEARVAFFFFAATEMLETPRLMVTAPLAAPFAAPFAAF
jgi:hypothetical protein